MNKSSCAGLQLQNASSKPSQVEDPLYSAIIANVVFSDCLCYITIMLNVVTIYALRKTSALSKSLKAFLQNLAFSDLGVGLLGQPLNIAYLVALLRCNFSNHDGPTEYKVRLACCYWYLSFGFVVCLLIVFFFVVFPFNSLCKAQFL